MKKKLTLDTVYKVSGDVVVREIESDIIIIRLLPALTIRRTNHISSTLQDRLSGKG